MHQTTSHGHALRTLLAALLLAAASPLARGQGTAEDDLLRQADEAVRERRERRAIAAEHERLAIEAFNRRDFDAAELEFLAQAEVDPTSFVARLNAALVQVALGKNGSAIENLRRAIELGFSNHRQLRTEPGFDPLRGEPAFRLLLDNWPEIMEAQRRARIDLAKGWLDGRINEYAYPSLRVDVLSAHDEFMTASAANELEDIAAWADAALMPGILDASRDENAPWVAVILPDRVDYLGWAVATFGVRARSDIGGIGGAYEHDDRRLVTQDLGATLRHEFVHVLHWRDMERRGQRHPIWIQEGLASLVEDFDADPAAPGGLRPAPSWRTNQVKRLGEIGRLESIREIAELDAKTFTLSRPLAKYAQARALFLFLSERGWLKEWYRIYTSDPERGYDADPIGLTAIETAAGQELDVVERDYKDWVRRQLPEIADEPDDLEAVLGIGLAEGEGDGVLVTQLPRGTRGRTGLRLRDVIIAIDGRPTRDLRELIRVLGTRRPGDEVEIGYRRGQVYDVSEAELVRRR